MHYDFFSFPKFAKFDFSNCKIKIIANCKYWAPTSKDEARSKYKKQRAISSLVQ